MRLLLLTFLLLFQTGLGGFNRIARMNELKEEAEVAYKAGDYETASGIYQTLIDTYQETSDEVQLNYANSLYKTGKSKEADGLFRELASNSGNKVIQSLAYQQLGIMATQDQNLQDAVTYFKQSLKSSPQNEAARYNYELARKKLEQQQDEQQQQNQNEQVEPSEWAKELKKKAEQLVDRNRFQEAFELMQQGLQQDPSVKAFQNFISRIGTIVEIEQK